jgi:pimeloyl-ACP methyl ester carboxylesterase
MADIEPGLRLHFVTVGTGARTAVLLHGFPQTWWEWHRLIEPLVDAGFRVVAPDYRGAGHSSRPAGGYDKRAMAKDIHRLLREHLQVTGPVVMIGHDIGLMVAYAYAQAYRGDVSLLVVMDAPLPGTDVFDRLRSDPRVWQFAFHSARDVPEMLVAGRERQYLLAFFDARIFDPSGISASDFDRYVDAYSAPGAMRAGFELYRAFDQDMVQYLKAGTNSWTLASGPTAEAVNHSTSRMTDEAIAAIATYLKDSGTPLPLQGPFPSPPTTARCARVLQSTRIAAPPVTGMQPPVKPICFRVLPGARWCNPTIPPRWCGWCCRGRARPRRRERRRRPRCPRSTGGSATPRSPSS